MNKAILYTDGGARGNPGPAGYSAILFNEHGVLIDFDGGYSDHATNNYAEYSGLIIGLKLAEKNKIKELECVLDSELVVKQLKGEYKVKDLSIKDFHLKIANILPSFNKISYKHVPRENNKFADRLVNIILDIKSK